jgi:DNA replication and repair protein RecF
VELSWLEVHGFRCYDVLRFEPDPWVNVLIGQNGAGKTSVLEAIGYLGLLRSFRGTGDESLVAAGGDGAVLRGEFAVPSGEVLVEVEIPAAGTRHVRVNGKRPRRYRDVLGQVPVVVFQPDDLDLVKRGPGTRRAYLDDLAAQLWPQAVADQQDFERSLRQRNALLRAEGGTADAVELEALDAQVAVSGARVYGHRVRLIDLLQAYVEESYRTVGGSGVITWAYESNWDPGDDAESRLAAALADRRRRDFVQRTTTAGPQRDDPTLVADGRSVRTMASQGEQRTVALALRMAAYRTLAEERSIVPILLLDDVFSELDPVRSTGVLDLLREGQVFVTTARDDDVAIDGKRWRVGAGAVT